MSPSCSSSAALPGVVCCRKSVLAYLGGPMYHNILAEVCPAIDWIQCMWQTRLSVVGKGVDKADIENLVFSNDCALP